jgi:DNA-binding NtrC family response regulator
METVRKILLVDLDDSRRESRVQLLTRSGYVVDVRRDHIEAERLGHEGAFDLVIVALRGSPTKAVEYSDQLCRTDPRLPILLLTDWGVFVPAGTLSRSLETATPDALIHEIARMLESSTHVRELPLR